LGLFTKFIQARPSVASSFISGLSEQFSFARSPLRVSNSVGLDNTSSNTIPLGDVVNSDSSDIIAGSDKGRTLSPSIGFSNISLKRRFNFDGHVFNLDTKNGWYHANGFVVHNCPVNTDCRWEVLEKSFHEEDLAVKALSAGYAASPATQSNGGAIRSEDLDSDVKVVTNKKKKRKALEKALQMDDLLKAVDIVLENRPDFDVDAAAYLITYLLKKGDSVWKN